MKHVTEKISWRSSYWRKH